MEASSEAVTASAKYAVDRLHLRVAWLCGVVLFLEGYDIAAVGYAVPSLVDAWRVAPSVFTQALTAGNVGLLLGSLCAGLLGDRLGRKPVLIGCVLVFGIFSLVTAFAGSPLQLAGARFLTGLGLGGGIPLTIALASDFAPPMAQGRLVILMTAGVAIGFTVGGWLASQVVRFLGWPGIFAVGGVLPLAIVPLLALRLPESVALRATTRPQNPVTALFRDGLAPSTALLWAMNLLNLLSNYFILLWMPAILHGIGVSPSWAIFGTTMYGLGTILGALLTAPLVDRLGVERVLTWVLAFWRFVRAVDWVVRSAVRVVLSHHLWRWHRRWRMPAWNQLAIGPDLSANDPLNRSGLGAGLRARRRYCWAAPRRRTAGTWLASA
jgi:MFS transporter, AAHS family, 4-hydroxybenzoate transporter